MQRALLASDPRPTQAEILDMERDRPRVRGDCIDGPRPCPWVSCRYHLALEITAYGRIIVHMDPEHLDEPDSLGNQRPTCALDLADAHELTLETISALFDMTRERVRQIETRSLERLVNVMKPYSHHPEGT